MMRTPMHLSSSGVRLRSLRLGIALAVGLAVTLAACADPTETLGDGAAGEGDGDGAVSSGGDEDLDELTFLSYLPLETLSLAPEMLAFAGGYFEEEGLDVELQPVNGSPVAIQGLLGGVAPITRAGGIDVLTASSQGQTLVNVGTLERGGGFRIVSADSNPIESITDLPGTTIGIGSEGGTSAKTMELAMDAAGLDPESVDRQVVGLTAATFALVQQGQLDGYMLGIDTAVMVGAQNEDAVVSPADLTADPDIQVYVSTPEAIESDGDQIERFMRAIRNAAQFIIEDESLDETLDIIRTSFDFAALNDDEVAKESLDAYRQVWIGDGTFELLETDVERWEDAYDMLVDAEMSDPGGDPMDWVTEEFVPAP